MNTLHHYAGKICLICFIALCYTHNGFSQQNTDLIPFPTHLEKRPGYFELSSQTQMTSVQVKELSAELAYLHTLLSSEFGVQLSTDKGKNSIELRLSDDLAGKEAYTLEVTPRRIVLSASDRDGVFYGIQTLRQLLLLNRKEGLKIPSLLINDMPAFTWRGSHLDVSRHFYDMDYLKRHIDRMALYKLNKFHFHLTDDQGWRVEIKKYPKLTSQSAYRTFNNHDSICMQLAKENPDFEIDPRFIKTQDGKQVYGGYYTQEQLKDLVAYAAERHIEIIPEIDMPGHMMAAIQAYPELIDGEMGWGELFSTPICPCKDEVYTFIEDVLDEVIQLFPSSCIHIGADEVDKTTWETSALCKKLMAAEGIEDVEQLQGYFVRKVQDIVQKKGKKAIVWDEALYSGIDTDVTVMYWRGWMNDAPRKATENGNRVIMTPTNPLYFDYSPDKSSLRNVYQMDVIYPDIPQGKQHLIIGAQANLWAETIPSENRADFLLFPRLLALSEVVWKNDKSLYVDFERRLLSHYPVLDKMGVAYRLPDLCGLALESVFVGEGVLDIQSPLPYLDIRYTTDGTVPTKESPLLDKPLRITDPVSIKLALFNTGKAKGDIYTINYKETDFAEAVHPDNSLTPGLNGIFYKQAIDQVAKIKEVPDVVFHVNNIEVPKTIKSPQFGLRFQGYIEVPETGIYSFFLTCDDAGKLYIADRLVIDNEGPHSPVEKSGQVALKKGKHPFRLDFVEGGGGYTLLLEYSMGNCDVRAIPDEWFYYNP